MGEDKKFSIEEAFKKIDKTIQEMEAEDVTLEQSFSLYKEGMELIEQCSKEIDIVEKKVIELSESGETHDFT
ncbi:MAG: exodeoxyribonuclease VII small subunit [Lachnospiraceae bacterium]|nr:exodeoxyribonuclease VII small subunit [Lachnospiraceae bacterium]